MRLRYDKMQESFDLVGNIIIPFYYTTFLFARQVSHAMCNSRNVFPPIISYDSSHPPGLLIKPIAGRSISSFQNEKFGAAYRSASQPESPGKKMIPVRAMFFRGFRWSRSPPRGYERELRCSAAHYIRNKRAAGGGARSNGNYPDCCNVSD